jgi:uncharacterized protein
MQGAHKSSVQQPTEGDIKRTSPYDSGTKSCAPLVPLLPAQQVQEWVPSRFNARALNAQGSMVLWNTLSGKINVFRASQKQFVEKMLSQKGFRGPLDALGKYLHERGYIVPKGTNEYRQFQLLFGKQHYRSDKLELILLASEDCNFRCTYCYEGFARGTMEPRVRQNIKDLVRRKVGVIRDLSVHWFGGEPLYGLAAIDDLAPFFLELATQHDWNYSASMTTNGYLLTPDTAQRLISWKVNCFQITLDGLAAQHDRNRPARDGSGTFQTIFENLTSLKASDKQFFVRLRINFDPVNYPHLDSLLLLLKETFGEDPRFGLAFHAVGKWGGPNDANLDVCGGEAPYVKARLQESAASKGLKSTTLGDESHPGGAVCYAARPYNLIIGASGQVMKCTVALDKDPANVVGRLEEGGELILNRERFARWVEPAFESDHNCRSCYLLPSCQGISCPLIRFESGKSPCETTCKHSLHAELVTLLTARLVPQARQSAVNSSGS